MSVEAYELASDGTHVAVPPSGSAPPSNGAQESAPDASGTGTPGATPETPATAQESAGAPPAAEQAPSPGEVEGAESDEDPPEAVTLEDFNRHMARLRRRQRSAERALDAERQRHQVELAQVRGRQETLERLLQGAAPDLPQTPAQPTGPPQSDQYTDWDTYETAKVRYEIQQDRQEQARIEHEARQREQQMQFQQQLMTREQAFRQAHPDFDTVVNTGLAGKVSPVLQQALMVVPDGPAVAYALARQPDLVQRLNTLPPPLVLVELGRLSPPPTPTNGTTNGASAPPPALPAPPTPLSGSGAGAPTGSYTDTMDQAAYRAWRKRTSTLPAWKER